MAEYTGETIDITPTWSALLPYMLEAYSNMRRKRDAKGCDGQSGGWCFIHDMGYAADEPDADDRCNFGMLTRVEQAQATDRLNKDFWDLHSQFVAMAKAADLAVEAQKASKQALTPEA